MSTFCLVAHGSSETKTETKNAPTRLDRGVFAAHRGGQGRDRTADLPLFRRSLIPTELPGQPNGGGHPEQVRGPSEIDNHCWSGLDATTPGPGKLAPWGSGGLGPQYHGEATRLTHSVGMPLRELRATQTGLEPATFAVTGRRANQLRHWALLYYVLPTGFEPALPP